MKTNKCPFCKSTNIEAIHFDGDGGYQILCNDCKKWWWIVAKRKKTKVVNTNSLDMH